MKFRVMDLKLCKLKINLVYKLAPDNLSQMKDMAGKNFVILYPSNHKLSFHIFKIFSNSKFEIGK